jgi:hypothetical protein
MEEFCAYLSLMSKPDKEYVQYWFRDQPVQVSHVKEWIRQNFIGQRRWRGKYDVEIMDIAWWLWEQVDDSARRKSSDCLWYTSPTIACMFEKTFYERGWLPLHPRFRQLCRRRRWIDGESGYVKRGVRTVRQTWIAAVVLSH